MSGMDEALRRLVAQVGAGTDAWIEGTPAAARSLLLRADRGLTEQAAVVSVAAPVGELNLSGLIAQLSGRADLDEQDDAVLELGCRRLTGTGRTVLLLITPHGIGRSALRYLQHMSRQAPRLVTVVLGSAPLAALLAEPAFGALRARWQAAPAIELGPQPAPLPVPVAAPTPVPLATPEPVAEAALPPSTSPPSTSPLPTSPPLDRRRRPVIWAASVLGAAGVAGLVWFAYGAPSVAGASANASTSASTSAVARASGGGTVSGIRLEAALVPLPPLAPVSAPSAVAAPAPPKPPLSLPQLAAAPLPTVPLLPVPAAASHPDALAALPPVPAAQAERLPPLRRPEPTRRFARARPYWPAPRDQEPVQYEPPPSYLGTYAIDPYGMRVFRYDP